MAFYFVEREKKTPDLARSQPPPPKELGGKVEAITNGLVGGFVVVCSGLFRTLPNDKLVTVFTDSTFSP